jgi:hypothetical protein
MRIILICATLNRAARGIVEKCERIIGKRLNRA